MPVLPDSTLSLTEVVQILMSAVHHQDLVDLELCVKIKLDHLAVFAPLAPLVTLTMVFAQQTRSSVAEMMTVDQMRNVWSQDSVFVLHHSLLIQQMEANARAHVRDSSVASMLTVHQPTHQSVFVRLDMEETQSVAVLTLMNVLVILVVQMPGVSMKMEATSVNVLREPEVIHTWLDVLVHHQELSVQMMMSVQDNWDARTQSVLILVIPSLVETMPSVSQKIMLPGVDAKLDTRMSMVNVPLCVKE